LSLGKVAFGAGPPCSGTRCGGTAGAWPSRCRADGGRPASPLSPLRLRTHIEGHLPITRATRPPSIRSSLPSRERNKGPDPRDLPASPPRPTCQLDTRPKPLRIPHRHRVDRLDQRPHVAERERPATVPPWRVSLDTRRMVGHERTLVAYLPIGLHRLEYV